LGAGFARFGSAFFPDGRNCEFWIVHHVWVAVAKNMERRHRSIFSVLVNKLRLVDSSCAAPRRLGRMAYLEIGLALGRQTSSGRRLCLAGNCYLRRGVLFQNRPKGM